MRRSMAALVAVTATILLGAAPAGAHRGWPAPERVSTPGQYTGLGFGAFTSDGTALLLWGETTDNGRTHLSVRAPGAPAFTEEPFGIGGAVVTDAHGGALAIAGTGGTLQARYRPAGGPFGPPTDLAAANGTEFVADAMNAAGDAVVAYTDRFDREVTVKAVRRAADGTVGTPVALSAPLAAGHTPRVDAVAIDTAGTATIVWRQDTGADQGPPRVWTARWTVGLPPTPATPLSAAGTWAETSPSVVTSPLGDTVVAWTESAIQNSVAAPLKIAFAHAIGGFGPTHDAGVRATVSDTPISAGIQPTGAFTLAFAQATGGDPPTGGGTLGPAYVIRGNALTESIGAPIPATSPYWGQADATWWGHNVLLALAPDDSGVVFVRDFHTHEIRAVRLAPAGGGPVGSPEVVACPGSWSLPVAARVDAVGHTALIWSQMYNVVSAEDGHQLQPDAGQFFSQDIDRATPAPSTCDADRIGDAWPDAGTIVPPDDQRKPEPIEVPPASDVPTGAPAPPPAPAAAPSLATPLRIGVPAHSSLRTLLRSGLSVRVAAPSAGRVSVRLMLPGRTRAAGAGAGATLLASRTLTVRAGQRVGLRLKLAAAAQRKLPKARRTTLELQVSGNGGAVTVQRIVLTR